MDSSVKPIPEGYSAVTPYLVVDDTVAAIAFYEKAFGAEPGMRMTSPDGSQTVHAEFTIGGARVMLSDACADWGARSPKEFGGTPVSLHLYVADADAVFASAIAAGATSRMEPSDTFWGARFGQVVDPFGHVWSIATQISQPTREEMKAGMEAMYAGR